MLALVVTFIFGYHYYVTTIKAYYDEYLLDDPGSFFRELNDRDHLRHILLGSLPAALGLLSLLSWSLLRTRREAG